MALVLRVHQYTLVDPLRGDGHSDLYRGHRNDDLLPVLVEVLVDEYPSSTQLARLRHEYAIEKELGIAGVLAPIGLEELGHGLVLVWADPGGVPLRSLLRSGPVPLALALQIAASLAVTLAQVHARGVIHKDINPDNVLVDVETRRTYLIGFGRALRLSHETPLMTSPGALEGTLAYLSPEQTGRMNRIVDRRSDLYSLGVVLYELFTGALPFVTNDVMELLYSHLVRRPESPHTRSPGLPLLVSDLVMKLLAKNAEDRYQHARALAEDLHECVDRLDPSGTLESFPLARGDRHRGGELDLPQRLYGREAELRALHRAWERVAAGGTELLLVRGYSGIGKSVLVHEIHKELTGAQGYFVAGKFDQLGRAVPYAALAEAFREFVHLLLTEPEPELERFRTRLIAALGDNAGLLTNLVGDLEQIIGPQAPVPELGTAASRNRFTRVFQQFLAVCTSMERPLVLFLDDLQWADLASLELLEAIFAAGAKRHLLVIGAYRSNEVDASHPLTTTLREIEAAGASTSTIELGPLARRDVIRFIADALGMTELEVAPLARLVDEKTEGNPFFLIQLLVALHEDGLLHYDEDARAYRWDEAGVRAIAASDNVVSFMAERISRLSRATCEALELAACIGYRFELGTLAVIAESSPRALARDLWEALEQGVIIPLDADYRFLQSDPSDPSDPAWSDPASSSRVEFRFLHDRVQQAAYARTDPDERAALHLRIGRLIRSSQAGAGTSGAFELVAHLNLGRALIRDPSERLDLAELNLAAGRKARAATAYEAAAGYFEAGVSLLAADSFEHTYALAFALYSGQAEAAMVRGAHARAEASIDTLLLRARTVLERAEVLDLRVVSCAAQGRSLDAVEAGVAGLRSLGFTVPDSDGDRQAAYERELAALVAVMAGRDLDELAAAASMDAADMRVAMKLARHTALSAFGCATSLGYWLTAFAANLSLAQGSSDQSASAFALLGAVVASTTTRFAEAHRLVKLALAVHERRGGDVHEACMLGFYFTTVSHYAIHWRALLPQLERARIAGVESGDRLFHSYTCSHWVIARSILGDPLDELREEVERMLAQMEANKLPAAAATQRVVKQTIACLEGRTSSPTSLSDEACDEAALVETMQAAKMSFALHWYRTSKGMLLYLAGDHAGALEQLERALAMIPIAFTPEACFFTALAILQSQSESESEPEPLERRASVLERCRRDLAIWAEACPANYRHRQLLVEAEAARCSGSFELAMDRYDRSIDAASEHDWPRDLALANELAAKFYLQRGRTRIARAYMTDASYGYARWGALAQVRRLAEQFPSLVPLEAQLSALRSRARDEVVDEIDMLAFARSLQTIAREVLVDNVVERMMQIVLQSAGAERGILILERDGALVSYAKVTADSPRVTLTLGTPLDDNLELPASVVRYAARRSESVVLDDALADERFAGDPYIARVRPRSIACLAMTHQGRGKGVLYLENNAASAAFTSRRLELLELLASQAVISLDNARLFDALREREAQWRALVSSAPDFIMIVDREHRIEYINKLAYGLELDQVVGARVEDLMTVETRAQASAELDRVFETGDHGSFESALDGLGGPHQLTARLGPILGEGGGHGEGVVDRVTLIASDVTAQRKLEEHLRQSQKMQAIGTLAGGIAHDFNNLLTVILGAAELCEIDIDGNPAALESLTEITDAAERAAGLTRQLLAFSRKQVLQPKPVDLDGLVADMTKMLTRVLGEQVVLEFERAGLPCPVFVDPGQMEQVIMNLSINARDAMPEGGTLTIAIHRGERVELVVSDQGSGMSEAVLERIFDPFFTTKPGGKGTGLGLSTVLGIVEQSGGSVVVDSEVGRGTTFRILLPVAEAAPSPALAGPSGEVPRGSESILVVEDEHAVQRLTARLLELQGYTVATASSGEEAVQIARQLDTLDLLITDVVMPGMNGRELAERITSEHPEVETLYTSGYTDDAIMRHGVLDGTKSFLHKPFSGEEIAREVRALLDRRAKRA